MLIDLNDTFPDYLTWPAAAVDEVDGFPGHWPGARIIVADFEYVFAREHIPENGWGALLPAGRVAPGAAYMLFKIMLIFDPLSSLTLLYEYDRRTGPSVAWFNLQASTARQRRQLDPLVAALAGSGRGGNPVLQLRAADYDAAALLINAGQEYETIARRFENRQAFDIAMTRRGVRSQM